MDKITAVNNVLRRVGLTPVSGLDTGGTSAQAHAERFLDDASRSIQARGWYFNTRRGITLTRNASNKIAVPSNTFRIDTDGSDKEVNVTVVGGNLYDLDNNTDVWSKDLVCTYVTLTDFSDLPETFADYMVSEAAFGFNRAHKKDKDLDALLQRELQTRLLEARREDNECNDVNLLNTTEMSQLRGRPRNYFRNVF